MIACFRALPVKMIRGGCNGERDLRDLVTGWVLEEGRRGVENSTHTHF